MSAVLFSTVNRSLSVTIKMSKGMKKMTEEIRKKLRALSEEDYKKFSRKLIPGAEHVMGIRLPVLRKMAKEIARGDFRAYLDETFEKTGVDSFHEEILFMGLVLGYAKMDREERKAYLDRFVPKIENWAQCDSCVSGYRFMEQDPDYWFTYLKKFRESWEEFELRFMIVSMMTYFIDAGHIDEILKYCGEIRHEGYYARMGNAWAISMCYVRFPEKTENFLKQDRLDDFTHNKAIQKIRESFRVSSEEKERLNLLKR